MFLGSGATYLDLSVQVTLDGRISPAVWHRNWSAVVGAGGEFIHQPTNLFSALIADVDLLGFVLGSCMMGEP